MKRRSRRKQAIPIVLIAAVIAALLLGVTITTPGGRGAEGEGTFESAGEEE